MALTRKITKANLLTVDTAGGLNPSAGGSVGYYNAFGYTVMVGGLPTYPVLDEMFSQGGTLPARTECDGVEVADWPATTTAHGVYYPATDTTLFKFFVVLGWRRGKVEWYDHGFLNGDWQVLLACDLAEHRIDACWTGDGRPALAIEAGRRWVLGAGTSSGVQAEALAILTAKGGNTTPLTDDATRLGLFLDAAYAAEEMFRAGSAAGLTPDQIRALDAQGEAAGAAAACAGKWTYREYTRQATLRNCCHHAQAVQFLCAKSAIYSGVAPAERTWQLNRLKEYLNAHGN